MAGTKVRSPNYPVISLGEAIPRARTVFEQENRHPASREVVARALGYGGLNGASLGVISALLKYDLLEQVGDQLRVSKDALDILLHQPGDPERAAAIRAAAFAPALWEELRDLYGDTLPSNHNLRAYLVKKGFNPKTVDGVIRSYRDTITLVEEEAGGSEATPDDTSADEDDRMPPTPTVARSGASPPPMGDAPQPPPPAPRDPNTTSFRYGLSPGVDVEVTFRGPFAVDDLELLRDYLELYERGLRRGRPDPHPHVSVSDALPTPSMSLAPPSVAREADVR